MKNSLFIFLFILGWSNTSAQPVDFHLQDSLSADELANIIKGSGIEQIFNVRIGRGAPFHFGSFNTYGVDNDFNMNAGIIMANIPIADSMQIPDLLDTTFYPSLGSPHPGLMPTYAGSVYYYSPWEYFSGPEDGPHDIPIYDTALMHYFYDSVFNNPALYLSTSMWTYGISNMLSSTYTRTEIQFDFIPTGDTIRFKYVVFGGISWYYGCSYEYYSLFTAFLSGSDIEIPYNIARVPGTQTVVSDNTIALSASERGFDSVESLTMYYPYCRYLDTLAPYTEYYVNNDIVLSDHVPFRGYTTPLEAVYHVNPCDTYHIKI